ncbi:MAG: flagellar motor switch protein FliM [Planctomycetota bacterium]
MSDILDQSEVDALLSAVDSGEVEEVRQDMRIFSRHQRASIELEVRPYDFKRPERVSKDQMRSLEQLHETFARSFGAGLSSFLRTIVEVKVSTCDQMTYSEFIASLPNPTSFNLLTPSPMEGTVCLEISPLIIYPLIDRLLGGTNHELFIPQRPLTVIEMRLIGKVISLAIEGLHEAWSGVRDIDFQVAGAESNPHLVQIVPPNEVVVVVGFELRMSGRAGTMNLCIPFNIVEPLMEDLEKQSWFSVGKMSGNPEERKPIAKRLEEATVNVSGLLARTTISMRDLLELQVGDLLLTEKPASSPSVVCVEGERKLIATLGQIDGNRAMRVLRTITPDDRV